MKLVALLFLFFSFWFSSCREKQKSEIPEFNAELYKGDTVNLINITKNKVTIIFFWSIFCDDCIDELSNIYFLYNKYKNNKRFSFLSVAHNTVEEINKFNMISDIANPYQQYKSYLKLDSLDIPILIGSDKGYDIYFQDDGSFMYGIKDTMEVNKLYKLFNFKGLPTTIIYSANGTMIYNYSGPRTTQGNYGRYRFFLTNKIDSLLND